MTVAAESPWRIPLADLRPDAEALEAAHDALASGWWSMGPRVAAFEDALAALAGVRHALAVANGTAALQLALAAVGCGPGDEVVLPSLNFVAAANAAVLAGARPVFCDVAGDRDLNLDPASLAAALGPRTRAVVVLHYGGLPCDVDAVRALCDPRGIRVVEDAAHAPGASHRGRPAGSLGDVACFSFFSNKNLPLGEGGAVVTDDDALAERLRLLRSHGMTTLTWDRHRGHAESYDVLTAGYNARLDEVRAAIGLVHLRRLAGWNRRRAEIAARYRDELDGEDGIVMPMAEPAGVRSAHHLAVLVFDEPEVQRAARRELTARRIQTSVHYPPIHRFRAYADAAGDLPRTDAVALRLLTLPLHPYMTDDAVDAVVSGVRAAARAPHA